MKTCPKCGAQFGDEMGFCLDDGSQLVTTAETSTSTDQPTAQYGEKTFELPSEAPSPTAAFSASESAEEPTATRYQPPEFSPPRVQPTFTPPGVQKKGSRSRYLLPLVLTGLSGILVLAAAGIGLLVYMHSRSVDVASANTSSVNRTIGNSQNIDTGSDPSNSSSPLLSSNSFTTNSETRANTESKPSPTPRTRTPTPTPNKVIDEQEPTVLATPPTAGRPTPRPNVPKTISGGVLNGRAISLPKPPYPPAARAVRASGPVYVQVLIDEDGRVVSATAVSGHPLLQAAAVAAARGARFSPTMLSGQPVKVSGIITYNFVP